MGGAVLEVVMKVCYSHSCGSVFYNSNPFLSGVLSKLREDKSYTRSHGIRCVVGGELRGR